jgi:hypothetical protein
VRKEEDDGGGVGWTIYPSAVILFHLWKIMATLSRSLRSGNGRADLTIHVSAPWEPRLPLRTVNKETVRTFLTHTRDVRSNAVNSRDALLLGPPCV